VQEGRSSPGEEGGVRIGRKVGELRMISWGSSCGIRSAGEHDDDVYVLFQQSLQISSNDQGDFNLD